MGAEKYIDRAQLERNIQAQRIPHKLLRDALNILEMDNKYLKIWKEKKEGWTELLDKKFTLSFGLFDITPQDIYKALHFLQWIPLTTEYWEDCYEKKNLTLDGCFYRICSRQVDGPSPYGEEIIFDLWRYTHKDEVRLFLKEYLENNKEKSFDRIDKKTNLKNRIFIDLRGLIYTENDKNNHLKISDKRLKIIRSLSKSQKTTKTIFELQNEAEYSKIRTVSTAIKEVNILFRKKLKQKYDLIILTGSGYGLNRIESLVDILNK